MYFFVKSDAIIYWLVGVFVGWSKRCYKGMKTFAETIRPSSLPYPPQNLKKILREKYFSPSLPTASHHCNYFPSFPFFSSLPISSVL